MKKIKKEKLILNIIGSHFTATGLNKNDMKDIEFKAYKNSITMQDKEGALGHMVTEIKAGYYLKELTIEEIKNFLVENGATKIKPLRNKRRNFVMYD